MPKLKFRVLYSTNTRLAFHINEEAYGGVHYVYCNPFFSAASVSSFVHEMPPSSTPRDLFQGYLADVERLDRHSPSIKRNKAGIRRGIRSKLKAGVIDEEKAKELLYEVRAADRQYFRPLLYVIPYTAAVAKLANPVPPSKAAALFSQEFLIEALPRSLFDVLSW